MDAFREIPVKVPPKAAPEWLTLILLASMAVLGGAALWFILFVLAGEHFYASGTRNLNELTKEEWGTLACFSVCVLLVALAPVYSLIMLTTRLCKLRRGRGNRRSDA